MKIRSNLGFGVSLMIALPLTFVACKSMQGSSSGAGAAEVLAATDSGGSGNGSFFDIKHVIQIEIKTSDWDKLRYQQPKGGHCNFEFTGDNYDWFHASEVKIDGQTFSDAGIKKRSFCNSQDDKKPAIGINVGKFNKDNKSKAVDAFGTASIKLSNSKQDPTYMRQCLAYQLFAEAGIASPRCNFAHVKVNDNDMGIFINIEDYTKDWAVKNYGSAGNIYELAGEAWDWWAMDRLKAHHEGFADDSMNDVKGLISAVQSDKSWDLNELAKHVDIKQFINYWSMEFIMIHWDAMARGNNNSYAYFGTDGKLRMAPWGTDQVFTEWGGGEDRELWHKNLVADRLINSKYKGQVYSTIWWYLDNQFDPNKIYGKLYDMEQTLKPYFNTIDQNQYNWSLQKLKDLVWNRKNVIAGFVPKS